MATWCVYLLLDLRSHRTYIGSTNDFTRRLRQHNGEISGGAKYTRGGKWAPLVVLEGFPDQRAALRFEWRAKRNANNSICRGGETRARNIHRLKQGQEHLSYRYNSFGDLMEEEADPQTRSCLRGDPPAPPSL